MQLEEELAKVVFRKVRQVREEVRAYCLAHDRPDLPVEEFQRVVGQMYGLKIEKFQVPFEATFLRGMLERYGDRAVIYVRKNQDEDWKRFVSIKELCHLVIDEPEDWSISGASIIRKLISEYKIDKGKPADRVIQSEVFAEIAAIELLYPHEGRAVDISNLESSATTIAKIASYYDIPEAIVERALSENHMELAGYVWSLVND